jgi:AbrB family looped-hinge helix DNA binding protein
MKGTGIVRTVDELGRVVIPKELRRNLNIKEGTPLEMSIEGNKLCMAKYTHGPVLDAVDDLRTAMFNLEHESYSSDEIFSAEDYKALQIIKNKIEKYDMEQ